MLAHTPQTEGFEWVAGVGVEDVWALADLADRRPGDPWAPARVELRHLDGRGRPLERAAMPMDPYAAALFLREEAIEAAGPLLAAHGELLEIACPQARLAAFNPPALAGLLDPGRSRTERFSKTGSLVSLAVAAFDIAELPGVGAFRIAERPRGPLYLAGWLVEQLRAAANTTGSGFKLVFDSGRPGGADLGLWG
jgi:hypothetical protein